MHYTRYIVSDQHHLLDDTSHRLLRHQALSRIERIQNFHGMAYTGCFRSLRTNGRARLKLDGTRAETRFGLSAKRTSPFKLAGVSVQSTTGSRRVRISGSNAGYTMFRGREQDYWLPTPLACFPFTSPTVRHRVPSGFN